MSIFWAQNISLVNNNISNKHWNNSFSSTLCPSGRDLIRDKRNSVNKHER
jgi:hypothetical protein